MLKKLFFVFALIGLLALNAKECTIFSVFNDAVVIDGYDFFYDSEKAPFALNPCDIVHVEYEREELPDDGYRLYATVTSETGQSQRLASVILSDKQYLKIAKVENVQAGTGSVRLSTMMGGVRVPHHYDYDAMLILENGSWCGFSATQGKFVTGEEASRALDAIKDQIKEGCYLEVTEDKLNYYPAETRHKTSLVTLYSPAKVAIVSGVIKGPALKRGNPDPHPTFYAGFEGANIRLNDNAFNSLIRCLHVRSFDYLYPEHEERINKQRGPGCKVVKAFPHYGSIVLEFSGPDGSNIGACMVSCGIGPGTPFQYIRSYKTEEGKLIIVLKHLWRNVEIEFIYC
jgi:hypothetical protein